MDRFLGLLGQLPDDHLAGVFGALRFRERAEEDGTYVVSSKRGGVEILLDELRRIHTIFLYGTPSQGFQAYTGEVSFAWEGGREAVRASLGTPDASCDEACWDVYHRTLQDDRPARLHFEYDCPAGGRVRLVTVCLLQEELVPVFIPSLAALLTRAEQLKGTLLEEVEVTGLRDSAQAVMMQRSQAERMAESRGYQDVDPERPWESWQELRAQLHR